MNWALASHPRDYLLTVWGDELDREIETLTVDSDDLFIASGKVDMWPKMRIPEQTGRNL
jgi:hypothetical protein